MPEDDIITKIQEEVRQQREIGGVWEGYCNLQRLASGDIWESSTRYIYELLQNAEDAKAKEFRIYISKKRVKIVHDGNVFTKDDVRNVCYAVSKKDPNETIGYLGVGFRSVFTVTDKPEIYSGKYAFCFDKEECLKEFGDDSPFYFYPYRIEQPTESIDPRKTTFLLPFKSKEFFDKSIEQLEQLGANSLLFLRNIKSLSIHNEEDDSARIYNITPIDDLKSLPNNEDIKIGKFLLVEGSTATRFLVFRGTFEVPDDVQEDEETKRAKRGEIGKREISIAIKLDEQDNLVPTKGYIYSFFPIEERKINFLVHADFIVQAGRVALLDNRWNRWIMEKAREVAEAAFPYFQENPEESKWIEQSPSIFEKREEISERYDDLFEKPLFEATKNPIVVCIEGDKVPLDETIKITEETEELIKRGFIKCQDIKIISDNKQHLIRKDYPTGGRSVEELSVDKLNSEEFIKAKTKINEGRGVEFLTLFYSIYKKAMERRYAHYRRDQREDYIKSDLGRLLVIDRNGNVKGQDEVWIEPDLKVFDELKGKGISVDEEQILSEYNLINKELWSEAKDCLPKVKKITEEMIVEKCILPKIKTSSEAPSKENVLSWTYLLKYYRYHPKEEIWIIDNKNQIRKSSEVFLSDKYNPPYHWQELGLPNIIFLSEEYLNLDNNPNGWKEFFSETSMKGYNSFDYEDYLKNTILPILKSEKEIKELSRSEIIKYTRAMFECNLKPEEPIFIVTKEGTIEKSNSDVYFSSQYSPKQNWESQCIISLKFVSPDYISESDDANKWRDFFETAGVKGEAPDEMIAEFGKSLVRKKFEMDGYKVEPYGGRGGDLKAIRDDEVLYIEVRSRSSGDISDEYLDSEKAKFAQEQKERYCLAKVMNIPDSRYIYLLKNPAGREGINFEMNIPKSIIERYSEKIDAKNLLGE